VENIRIIPRLDIKNGLLIKGINFEGLRALGDPDQFAKSYYLNKADEIIYIDSVATLYGTNNLSKFISNTAKNIFVPLTVGGGIRTNKDIERTLRYGADKVSINSAVVKDIKFLKKAVQMFGSSTIACAVECIKIDKNYFISISNGRDLQKVNPFDWIKKLQDNGAGEISISSINHEGLKGGFDLELYEKVSKIAKVPVLAHGGAGSFDHVYKLIRNSNISGVIVSSLFHYDTVNMLKFKKKNIGNFEFLLNLKKKKFKNNIVLLKKYLKKKKINVRI
tara:strand:- start:151 stop:984 length:834 start_codon:yes stop_codon:yes gene_type:complete